ncbi:isoleucine--tRNA ligase [bacterium]|nr:isoleucine--tRNA ligase [bacterium]
MPFREAPSSVDFPKMEKEILSFWDSRQIFEKSVRERPEDRPFIFYEGPPTANGRPGIHHVISRSIKDFVCRLRTMQGYRVHRKAGWDTHGLPVEIEVEKELGIQHKEQIEAYGVDRFNRKCRESVFRYVGEWNELTRRIGFWVDLEHPYITYDNDYIETIWWLLAQFWKKGHLYQGFKILTYCPRCETALSSHETSLGYRDVTERSVTVKFRLTEGENRFVLAWTTTPWTLPGNVALAVGEDIDYVEAEQDTPAGPEIYFLAEARLSMLKGEARIRRRLKGKEMVGWRYKPLFDDVNLEDESHPAYRVAAADFVNTEDGTGVVHTAVMYGEDDYQLGLRIGLPAKHTVDEKGLFNDRVPRWTGRSVKDPEVEQALIDALRQSGLFYRQEKFTHAYPHCWRCDSPLLYYAKKSWYLRTTAFKEKLIENNRRIRWFPRDVGEGRFGQWLENNIDWALSRDRYWGTPLNLWVCDSCGKVQAVGSRAELKSLSGGVELSDLHKPYIDAVTFPCPDCGGTRRRTPEVIDCWFDSGAMPYAQFHHPFAADGRFEKSFPADFIAEGIDQTRGWFYSLLVISTLISDRSAYRDCVSIELILDKTGQKMSKTRGNAVDPFGILDETGADPLRWYLFTVSPPWVPTRFDAEGVREVKRKFFGTLVNTYSFFVMYANIDGWEPGDDPIPVESRPEIDRWLLSVRNTLVRDVAQVLERYDSCKAAKAIQDFVIDDLSNWYVRRNRRRFWKAELNDDKRSAYQTLFETLLTLAKLIAPFSPFFVEDMYRNLNQGRVEPFESVHLAGYPDPAAAGFSVRDEDLERQMKAVQEAVSLCRAARNEAGLRVRQPLARAVVHATDPSAAEALARFESLILEEVNVLRLEVAGDPAALMRRQAGPVFRKLGPKFGPKSNAAAERIRSLNAKEIADLENTGRLSLTLSDGTRGEIALEDVELTNRPAEDFAIQSGDGMTVGLDTRLTPELTGMGITREFVHHAQNLRKEFDFKVTDRVRLVYESSDRLSGMFEARAEYIRNELLADHFSRGAAQAGSGREIHLDGESVTVFIEKAG